MAVTKLQKVAHGEFIAQKFNKANAAFTAEYSGITASELAELRVELRKINCEFKIVKNRVAIKALETKAQDSKKLSPKLRGPVGIAYVYGDVAASAKTLVDYSKKNDKLKITGCLLGEQVISYDDVLSLSELPSKEVLLAKLIGTLVAPHRNLLSVLNGISGKLVRVLSAIKDQKQE